MDQTLTPKQLQTLLGAPETQQLLSLLQRDGGAAWKRAVQAVQAGDYTDAQAILEPLLSGTDAPAIARDLEKKLG